MSDLATIQRGLRETKALIDRHEELAVKDHTTKAHLDNLKTLRRMRERFEEAFNAAVSEACQQACQQAVAPPV